MVPTRRIACPPFVFLLLRCAAIVSPDMFFSIMSLGALRRAVYTIYSAAVRDEPSLVWQKNIFATITSTKGLTAIGMVTHKEYSYSRLSPRRWNVAAQAQVSSLMGGGMQKKKFN